MLPISPLEFLAAFALAFLGGALLAACHCKYVGKVDATTALASPLYTVDGDLSQFIVGSSISAALSPVRENFTLSGSTLSVNGWREDR